MGLHQRTASHILLIIVQYPLLMTRNNTINWRLIVVMDKYVITNVHQLLFVSSVSSCGAQLSIFLLSLFAVDGPKWFNYKASLSNLELRAPTFSPWTPWSPAPNVSKQRCTVRSKVHPMHHDITTLRYVSAVVCRSLNSFNKITHKSLCFKMVHTTL